MKSNKVTTVFSKETMNCHVIGSGYESLVEHVLGMCKALGSLLLFLYLDSVPSAYLMDVFPQAGFELTILLPQHPEYQYYRTASS